MPLTEPDARREIHSRVIDMKAYERDDGMYDVESHLVDRKPFAFTRFSTPQPWPAGMPLHDLRIRVTLDRDLVVRAIEASSDMTPHGICKEAERTLSVLVGERIARGWTSLVKERLRGAASCTHLMEMLLSIGTTALQGIRAMRVDAERGDIQAATNKIDSCYAYGRQREVVQRLWPQHYVAPKKPEAP